MVNPNPLRRVEGVTYWTINDPNQIRGFMIENVRHEWEKDDESDNLDPRNDHWLRSLPKLSWSLRTIKLEDARLDSSMMGRRTFVERLEERSKELAHVIEHYHVVIWPVVLRGEDFMLKDGYCRYATLKRLHKTKALAYIGR
jgi:hypothetical protein